MFIICLKTKQRNQKEKNLLFTYYTYSDTYLSISAKEIEKFFHTNFRLNVISIIPAYHLMRKG